MATARRLQLDGHDIRDLALRSLRASIAVVPQDIFLFDERIRTNLLFARPDATEQELVAAARAAAIDDFIQTLLQAYETTVGERGIRLSGGERQRLALARALLKDAPVVVLDEATSAVDALTEATIRDNVLQLARERTVITIAHRLSTVAQATRIYVLDQGRVVASGTHQQLLVACPLYAQLHHAPVSPLLSVRA